ncbi:MAG: DUF2075 domain-containing protein [Candidatus Eremiobacteraeota bacterium]|nr:DUF2075 domain-containing protein [Candidatus Eremiobacteraeota bacterium]
MLNSIAAKLNENFKALFSYQPPISELRSWRNSLQALAVQIMYANLRDNGIILEMQMPLTSARLDCLLTGRNGSGNERAVIIELKQWEKASNSNIDECVETFLAGKVRTVPHPCVQVQHYRQYLTDTHSAFNDQPNPIGLASCSFLHNFSYDPLSALYDSKFAKVLHLSPLFAGNESDELANYLNANVGSGHGDVILQKVQDSRYRASKQLLSHVAEVIKGDPLYTLLDDQIVAFNTITTYAKKGFHRAQKVVIIIKGGPGTGKSLIALNVMASLSQLGYNTQHATGSKAFTENLRRAVGARATTQFRYFNSYSTSERDVIDVLLLDEAHRIREKSNSRFTPREARSERSQVDELIRAAKVTVFFIDDKQVVRPGEVGSSELICGAAGAANAKLVEEELKTQFRCGGSENYIGWLDQLLGIKDTGLKVFECNDSFDFQICDTPHELEASIQSKVKEGFNARIAAGFCWPWSDPDKNGVLVNDIVIDDYERPWNAKLNGGRLATNIPRASYWASDPNGFAQIGCVYTAQGFEFDYIGVIFGKDLTYDMKSGKWVGHPECSKDSIVAKRAKLKFMEYVKNTYRVLLTRGIKGCYVYFLDAETREYVQRRIAS